MNKENQIQQIADEAIKKIQAIRDAREEKEYRAGEWVPNAGKEYWYIVDGCNPSYCTNTEHHYDISRFNACNVYPTKAIAEAAKAHADWWREFDLIVDKAPGDKPKAECGRGYVTYKTPDFNIGQESTQRLGGEQKVIEMLNAGRVFRFKWGGQ